MRELINWYLNQYPNYKPSEIADVILENEEGLSMSRRALKLAIADVKSGHKPPYIAGPMKSIMPHQIDVNILTALSHSKLSPTKAASLKPFTGGLPENVLIIGDTHFPFERKGYLEHCRAVQEKYNCGKVIHIGDVIDNHYSSYHETDPDGYSAGQELDRAIDRADRWQETFPEMDVLLGNHDLLIARKAQTSGVSRRWIKTLPEVLGTPGWSFYEELEYQGVYYVHGTGSSGDKAAFNRALNRRQSVVQGHLHTIANIAWNVSKQDRIFAMQTGCGIDDNAYAMAYGKVNPKKSIISCGVVIDGKIPIIVPMEL